MEFMTIDHWDEALWDKVKGIYKVAFSHGAKPEKIIRNMFAKDMCSFHTAKIGDQVFAMALTGSVRGSLIIDYLAVHQEMRQQGIGKELCNYIKKLAVAEGDFGKIIIEVESGPDPHNQQRIRFWESCGFTLADDYVHLYIWVPEPYQAMWLNLRGNRGNLQSGKRLFRDIQAFHRESFRQK